MKYLLPLALLIWTDASAQPLLAQSDRVLLRDVFKELVEIPTAETDRATPRAARAMAERLAAAGFAAEDVRVLAPKRAFSSPVCAGLPPTPVRSC